MKFPNSVLRFFLILLLVLNIFDAYATFYWVTNGLASERNPIMQEWLHLNPFVFIYIKLILVGIAIGFLWTVRNRQLTHILIIPLILTYMYVFILHCNIAYLVFYN